MADRALRAMATSLVVGCLVMGNALGALPLAYGLPVELTPSPPETAPTGECEHGYCHFTAGDLVAPNAGAAPVASDPGEEATLTNALLATVYETSGISPCLFNGLRRDDEIDLAIGDIERVCNEDADPEDEDAPPSWEEVVALIAREYLTLQIAPSPISHQPDGYWALINIDFIVMTDAQPQVFERQLLGMDITFVATPVHYSWDFGDGSPPLQTSSPGHPYPNQDVAHVYTSAADAVEVSLTTTWQGSFQINGSGPWLPVSGFATTTAVADPVEIVAMDVHLVPNP